MVLALGREWERVGMNGGFETGEVNEKRAMLYHIKARLG